MHVLPRSILQYNKHNTRGGSKLFFLRENTANFKDVHYKLVDPHRNLGIIEGGGGNLES